MQFSILKFVALVIGSAVIAVFCSLPDALRIARHQSKNAKRALLSEFLGFWIGSFFLLLSAAVDSKFLQWTFRGVTAIAAIESIRLSYHFSNANELQPATYSKPFVFKKSVYSEPIPFNKDIAKVYLRKAR